MAVIYTKPQLDAIAVHIGQAIKDAQANMVFTDQNGGGALKIWTGTQAEYDAVAVKDAGILYVVKA